MIKLLSDYMIALFVLIFIIGFMFGLFKSLFNKTRVRYSYCVRYIGDNIIYLPCVIRSRCFFDKIEYFENINAINTFPFLYFFSMTDCKNFLKTL